MEITGDKLRYVALFASVFALNFLDCLTSNEIKGIIYYTDMKYSDTSNYDKKVYKLGSIIKPINGKNIYRVVKFTLDPDDYQNSFYEVSLISKISMNEPVRVSFRVGEVTDLKEKPKSFSNGREFYDKYGNAMLFNVLSGLLMYRKNDLMNIPSDLYTHNKFKMFVKEIVVKNATNLLDTTRTAKERLVELDKSLARIFQNNYEYLSDISISTVFADVETEMREKQIMKPISVANSFVFSAGKFDNYVDNEYDFKQLPLLPSEFQLFYTSGSQSLPFNLLNEFCKLTKIPYDPFLSLINDLSNFVNNPVSDQYLKEVTGLSAEEINQINQIKAPQVTPRISAFGGSKTKRNLKQHNNTKKLRGGMYQRAMLVFGFVMIIQSALFQNERHFVRAVGQEQETCFKLLQLNFTDPGNFSYLGAVNNIKANLKKLTNTPDTLQFINNNKKNYTDAKVTFKALGDNDKDKLYEWITKIVFDPEQANNYTFVIDEQNITGLDLKNVVNNLLEANTTLLATHRPEITLYLITELLTFDAVADNWSYTKLQAKDFNELSRALNQFKVKSCYDEDICIYPVKKGNSSELTVCPEIESNISSILNQIDLTKSKNTYNDNLRGQFTDLRNKISNATEDDIDQVVVNLFSENQDNLPLVKEINDFFNSAVPSAFLTFPKDKKEEKEPLLKYIFFFHDLISNSSTPVFLNLSLEDLDKFVDSFNDFKSKYVTKDFSKCPTAEPTTGPTPTANPTSEPSANPTTEPNANPTTDPTANPTSEPTANPTSDPSANPTTEPNANPTSEPSANPTTEPNANPTTDPTTDPTANPTENFKTTVNTLIVKDQTKTTLSKDLLNKNQETKFNELKTELENQTNKMDTFKDLLSLNKKNQFVKNETEFVDNLLKHYKITAFDNNKDLAYTLVFNDMLNREFEQDRIDLDLLNYGPIDIKQSYENIKNFKKIENIVDTVTEYETPSTWFQTLTSYTVKTLATIATGLATIYMFETPPFKIYMFDDWETPLLERRAIGYNPRKQQEKSIVPTLQKTNYG